MPEQAVAKPLQPPDAAPQQPAGRLDVPSQATRLDDQVPLTDGDLIALLPTMGKSQFFKRKKRGDFTFLEMSPQLVNGHTLYSRRLVALWFGGRNLAAGAPRRHFGKGSLASIHPRSVKAGGAR